MLGANRTCFLERLTETRDSGGALTESWSTVKKLKGFLRSMRGKELFMYSREMANVSYKLIVYETVPAYVTDRIRIGSDIYDIEHIDQTLPKYTKFYLELRK